MQILVVCRPVRDGDQAEFRRLVPAESTALRELKERGVLSNAWTPGRPGAVLTLEVGTEDDAAAVASRAAAICGWAECLHTAGHESGRPDATHSPADSARKRHNG